MVAIGGSSSKKKLQKFKVSRLVILRLGVANLIIMKIYRLVKMLNRQRFTAGFGVKKTSTHLKARIRYTLYVLSSLLSFSTSNVDHMNMIHNRFEDVERREDEDRGEMSRCRANFPPKRTLLF